jgi:methyl-accepting chemotaxis protein
MHWFRNLTTGRKLAVAFGVLEVLMISLGVLSLAELSSVNAATVQIVAMRMPSVHVLGNLKYNTSAIRRRELSYLLAVDHKERREAVLQQSFEDFEQTEKQYESLIGSDEERAIYERFHESWEKYLSVHAQVMAMARTNEYQAGVLAQTAGNEAFENAVGALQEEVDFNDKIGHDAGMRAQIAYASSRYWIIALLSCAVAAACILATLIARSISIAISSMLHQMQEIAANNLAVDDIAVNSRDEIGEAGIALNRMKNNLCGLIKVIATTAQQLANASEEISSGAGEAAQRARSQADKTQQVASAMQEMTTAVQQVSGNSRKASESSQQSAQAARDGGAVAEETLTTMRRISDATRNVASRITELGKRSQQIGQIAAVIDDIADQTNLLALNAAIEAARAGEKGRGFAVVADEVRKLAERTAAATKEIASMIEAIQTDTQSAVTAMELNGEEVQHGVEHTQASGDALHRIIEMSQHVGDMITQIATASGQQYTATGDVNTSIAQIASLANEASQTAEHTANACTNLSTLALDLQNLVARFALTTSSEGTIPSNRTPLPVRPKELRLSASAGAR